MSLVNIERPRENRPDFSATTVSLNMHDYQKLKQAAYGAAELQTEVDELNETVVNKDANIVLGHALRASLDTQLTMALAEVKHLKEYIIHREDRHSESVEDLKAKLADSERYGSAMAQSRNEFKDYYKDASTERMALKEQLKKTNARSNETEQEIVFKYLCKYADSIANLKPGEHLVMQAVPAKEDL